MVAIASLYLELNLQPWGFRGNYKMPTCIHEGCEYCLGGQYIIGLQHGERVSKDQEGLDSPVEILTTSAALGSSARLDQ